METPTAPPVPRPAARADLPVTATPPVRRDRRWWAVALCVVLAVVCALGAAAAVTSAGDRSKVLAVARDVPAGQALKPADVTVAEVSSDAALTPIAARDKNTVIGKRAATDLRKGGLLVSSQLAASSGLGDDKQQVGVQIKRGQAPDGTLAAGDKVLAVTTPAQGEQPDEKKDDRTPSSIEATVVSLSRPDASGTVVVNLAVAETEGPLLATHAAAGRIALVREPRSS